MKKISVVILFLAFTALTKQLTAQEFCPEGATWHFDYNYFSAGGYQKVECIGDTNIAGRLYKHLSRVEYSKDYSNPNSTGSGFKKYPIFLRQSQDSVFAWINDEDQHLYHFNTSPGEQWLLKGDMNFCHQNDVDTLFVENVGTEIIQGIAVRYIEAKVSDKLKWSYGERIYEYIGPLSFILPSPGPYCHSDPDEASGLRCYMDDYFGQVKFRNYACNFMSGIEHYNYSRTRLISFNHEESTLNILDPKVQSIEVRSVIGQLLLQIKDPSEILDLSSLPVGIHIITAKTGERTELYKIITN